MKNDDRASMIAMLENMRAQLEPEGTQVGSAIHKSRELLAEAIDALRSIEQKPDDADRDHRPNPGGSESMQESGASPPLPAEAEPQGSRNPSTEGLEPAVADLATTTPSLSNSLQTRIPTLPPLPHAVVDASALARQDEEDEKSPRSLNHKHTDIASPNEAREAAVTFVIRENVEPKLQADNLASPRAQVPPDRAHRAGDDAHYVASRQNREEAEVVVVKPQTHQSGPDLRRPKQGPVRRLMNALKGG